MSHRSPAQHAPIPYASPSTSSPASHRPVDEELLTPNSSSYASASSHRIAAPVLPPIAMASPLASKMYADWPSSPSLSSAHTGDFTTPNTSIPSAPPSASYHVSTSSYDAHSITSSDAHTHSSATKESAQVDGPITREQRIAILEQKRQAALNSALSLEAAYGVVPSPSASANNGNSSVAVVNNSHTYTGVSAQTAAKFEQLSRERAMAAVAEDWHRDRDSSRNVDRAYQNRHLRNVSLDTTHSPTQPHLASHAFSSPTRSTVSLAPNATTTIGSGSTTTFASTASPTHAHTSTSSPTSSRFTSPSVSERLGGSVLHPLAARREKAEREKEQKAIAEMERRMPESFRAAPVPVYAHAHAHLSKASASASATTSVSSGILAGPGADTGPLAPTAAMRSQMELNVQEEMVQGAMGEIGRSKSGRRNVMLKGKENEQGKGKKESKLWSGIKSLGKKSGGKSGLQISMSTVSLVTPEEQHYPSPSTGHARPSVSSVTPGFSESGLPRPDHNEPSDSAHYPPNEAASSGLGVSGLKTRLTTFGASTVNLASISKGKGREDESPLHQEHGMRRTRSRDAIKPILKGDSSAHSSQSALVTAHHNAPTRMDPDGKEGHRPTLVARASSSALTTKAFDPGMIGRPRSNSHTGSSSSLSSRRSSMVTSGTNHLAGGIPCLAPAISGSYSTAAIPQPDNEIHRILSDGQHDSPYESRATTLSRRPTNRETSFRPTTTGPRSTSGTSITSALPPPLQETRLSRSTSRVSSNRPIPRAPVPNRSNSSLLDPYGPTSHLAKTLTPSQPAHATLPPGSSNDVSPSSISMALASSSASSRSSLALADSTDMTLAFPLPPGLGDSPPNSGQTVLQGVIGPSTTQQNVEGPQVSALEGAPHDTRQRQVDGSITLSFHPKSLPLDDQGPNSGREEMTFSSLADLRAFLQGQTDASTDLLPEIPSSLLPLDTPIPAHGVPSFPSREAPGTSVAARPEAHDDTSDAGNLRDRSNVMTTGHEGIPGNASTDLDESPLDDFHSSKATMHHAAETPVPLGSRTRTDAPTMTGQAQDDTTALVALLTALGDTTVGAPLPQPVPLPEKFDDHPAQGGQYHTQAESRHKESSNTAELPLPPFPGAITSPPQSIMVQARIGDKEYRGPVHTADQEVRQPQGLHVEIVRQTVPASTLDSPIGDTSASAGGSVHIDEPDTTLAQSAQPATPPVKKSMAMLARERMLAASHGDLADEFDREEQYRPLNPDQLREAELAAKPRKRMVGFLSRR